MNEVVKSKTRGALTKFDPLKAKVVISGLKAAAAQAAKMRNWAASDEAIEMLVDWQTWMVAFWRQTTPDPAVIGAKFGRGKKPLQQKLQGFFTHAEKESSTGIRRQQIDRWAERLEDRARYVLALRSALQRVAMARGSKEMPTQISAEAKAVIEVYREDALTFLARVREADLLLTDPPYMTDVNDIAAFVGEWVPAAMATLKPSGRAYIFTGAYPLEIAAYAMTLLKSVGPGWIVDSPLVWTYRNTLGPMPTHDYKINWQACWHVYGPEAPPLNCPSMVEQFSVQDINAPDARTGFRQHAWQKPDELAQRLVAHGSKPGDVVIDPFCGTGTFLIAAAEAGRTAFGCDTSDEMLEFCRERGIDVE